MIDALRIAFPGKLLVLTGIEPRQGLTAHLAGNLRLPMIERFAHLENVQLLRLPDALQTLLGLQEMCRRILNQCPLLVKVKCRVQQSTLKEHDL